MHFMKIGKMLGPLSNRQNNSLESVSCSAGKETSRLLRFVSNTRCQWTSLFLRCVVLLNLLEDMGLYGYSVNI
jgi:hypothetical protein